MPAADALVPVVEVPAELVDEEAPTEEADEAAAAALAAGVSAPPPGAGTEDVAPDEVSVEKVETAEAEAEEQEAAAGLAEVDEAAAAQAAAEQAAADAVAPPEVAAEEAAPEAAPDPPTPCPTPPELVDAPPEVALADAAQEAAAGVAPPEDAEAREAAAVAEEAAVADAALAESAGAAPVAASTREPSGFLDLAALRSAAEGSGLKLPDSVYAGIVAALASGKHLVLAGPAGSGKTTLAVAVAKAAVQAGRSEGAALSTASPKWTAHDTVGRVGESGFTQGHVLSAAGKKKWLIVDEIDRAKLDKAFGDLSSFLGGLPLSLPDGSREIAAPKDWRIVATRDSSAGAPEASAALLRRFAEIRLPRPDAADLDAAIDAATEGDPMAAAVVKRLAADEDLAELGAGPFLDAARHAAERNALSPASEEELEQEIRTAYLALAGLRRRPPRLDLVRVVAVPLPQVGQRHRDRVVLHLPHVAELVDDQVVGDLAQRPLQQDQRRPQRVAVEAPEPRQPEQPRHADAPAPARSAPAPDRTRAGRAAPSRAQHRDLLRRPPHTRFGNVFQVAYDGRLTVDGAGSSRPQSKFGSP